jgi:hypothetical protein
LVSTSDPGEHVGDYDQANALAPGCNAYQARMASDQKRRFGMLVTLSLLDIDNALADDRLRAPHAERPGRQHDDELRQQVSR